MLRNAETSQNNIFCSDWQCDSMNFFENITKQKIAGRPFMNIVYNNQEYHSLAASVQ